MIEMQSHSEGVLLPVRAQPGSRKNSLRGEQNGALKVAVTQVAEKGKANKAVVDFLCKALGLRKSQLQLITGETSQQKQFLVRDMTLDELKARIEKAICPD